MKLDPHQKDNIIFCCIMAICLLFAGSIVLLVDYIEGLIPKPKISEYTVTVDDVKYPHCMVKEGQIVLEDRKTILVPGQFSTLKVTLEN